MIIDTLRLDGSSTYIEDVTASNTATIASNAIITVVVRFLCRGLFHGPDACDHVMLEVITPSVELLTFLKSRLEAAYWNSDKQQYSREYA